MADAGSGEQGAAGQGAAANHQGAAPPQGVVPPQGAATPEGQIHALPHVGAGFQTDFFPTNGTGYTTISPDQLQQLFAHFNVARQERPRASTHEELISNLERAGELDSEDVKRAFGAVKRKTYCVGAMDDEECYADRPFRAGGVHLSAPSIYARCVEVLELRRGHSFLNVGSGTGWRLPGTRSNSRAAPSPLPLPLDTRRSSWGS